MENILNILVAADSRWGIGQGGRLLVSIPQDRQFFRNETLGKVIVMGRATFESLPGSQPLYGRDNVVLSRNPDFHPKGVTVMRSMKEVLKYLEKYNSDDIFIIGGESIYESFLEYCDTAHVTAIEYEYEADRHIIDFDKSEDWKLAEEGDEETYFDLIYKFKKYIRQKNI